MVALIKPLRFRFTEPEDIKNYGPDWYLYDESKWTRLPARELIEIETELGVPLVDVMTGVRASSVFGDLAATWVAMRTELGKSKAGSFEDYSPIVMAIEWASVPEQDDPGKDEGPEPLGEDDSAPLAISQTDTVSLQTLPAAE